MGRDISPIAYSGHIDIVKVLLKSEEIVNKPDN
jgi:hypothetical protein